MNPSEHVAKPGRKALLCRSPRIVGESKVVKRSRSVIAENPMLSRPISDDFWTRRAANCRDAVLKDVYDNI